MVRLSYHKSYKYLIRLDGVYTQPSSSKCQRRKTDKRIQLPHLAYMTKIHFAKKNRGFALLHDVRLSGIRHALKNKKI